MAEGQEMSNGVKFILAEKLEMTQLFNGDGNVVPVTLLRATPNTVVMVRTKEKDGYEAVQVGAGERKQKNIKKPQRGHFSKLGNFRYVREFRADSKSSRPIGTNHQSQETLAFERGQKIDIAVFREGDTIRVSGVSKAKGFQGVVKRHGFHGAPATHGTKHAHREPGSIGGGGGRAGGRVVKGMKMAGRMGGERVTVRNLKIAKVDVENNLLAVRGAVPGRRGTLVEIRG